MITIDMSHQSKENLFKVTFRAPIEIYCQTTPSVDVVSSLFFIVISK
jgi:hypothetical protein